MKIKPAYMILIIITFFVECLYDSPALLGLTIMEIILMAISMISVLWAGRSLEVKFNIPSGEGVKGKIIPVGIEITEKSFCPVSMIRGKLLMSNHFYEEEEICNTAVSSSRGKTRIFWEITSEHYGDIDICMEDLWLYDIFRIVGIKIKNPLPDRISVMPVIKEKNSKYHASNVLCIDEKTDGYTKGQDSSEVSEIRPYQKGDRIQRIHWKLSARTGELMVKEYGSSVGSIIFFLDMKYEHPYVHVMDRYLEKTAAVADGLLKFGQDYYISWFDTFSGEIKREQIRQRKDLYRCFRKLFRSVPYRDEADLAELYTKKYGKEEGNTHFLLDLSLKLWKDGEIIDDACGESIEEGKSERE